MGVTINQRDSFKFLLKPCDVESELIHVIRKAIVYAEF